MNYPKMAIYSIVALAIYLLLAIGWTRFAKKTVADLQDSNGPVYVIQYKGGHDSSVYGPVKRSELRIDDGVIHFSFKGKYQEFSTFKIEDSAKVGVK